MMVLGLIKVEFSLKVAIFSSYRFPAKIFWIPYPQDQSKVDPRLIQLIKCQISLVYFYMDLC